jgi:TPR repeat protein
MRLVTLKLIALLLFSAPLAAAQNNQANRYFDYGIERMREGNYAEAYCYLRPLADRGHADAQYTLGWMYHNGYGLRIDDEKAFEWWNRSAGADNRDAIFALGLLYEQGLGTEKSPAKAAEMYLKAARNNSEDALSLIHSLIREPSSPLYAPLMEGLGQDWQLVSKNTWIVKSEKANVRKGPGKKHAVQFVLTKDQKLYELGRSAKWLKVGVDGDTRHGWLHQSLLSSLKQ